MIHPLHPHSPQYAELRDAGRLPPRADSAFERDPMLCSHQYEDRYGRGLCDEPATNVLARADGIGVTWRVCDRDLRHYGVGLDAAPFVVARVSCSSCDVDAKRYELDASGRCDECAP